MMPKSMADSLDVGCWVFGLDKSIAVDQVFRDMELKFPGYWERNGDPFLADYIHANFVKDSTCRHM